MSEVMENKNTTTEEMNDQAPAEDKQQETTAAEDKQSEKIGIIQRVKNFAKTKAIPAAKFVGKGLIKGATVAGGALATAYFIGAAAGGYAAAKEKANEDSNKDQEQSSCSDESATAEKPAEDQDVQVILNENNVQTETNIE